MRYPAAEKLEIIRMVEQSALPVRRTLEKIGIPRATFYRWYDLYQSGGPEALDDRHPKPDRVWNRIPDDVRVVAEGIGGAVYRHRRLFCLGGIGLSAGIVLATMVGPTLANTNLTGPFALMSTAHPLIE